MNIDIIKLIGTGYMSTYENMKYLEIEASQLARSRMHVVSSLVPVPGVTYHSRMRLEWRRCELSNQCVCVVCM